MRTGRSVICQPSATFIAGPTASIWRPGSRNRRSASWSSSARRPEGKKELVGFTDGMRESSQSWRDLLLDLKRRGLTTAPQIAVADGALGFWKALGEVWPTTREQRCWVHKTANILNKLPKSLHTKAKRALQEIWMAETKKDAVCGPGSLCSKPTRSNTRELPIA